MILCTVQLWATPEFRFPPTWYPSQIPFLMFHQCIMSVVSSLRPRGGRIHTTQYPDQSLVFPKSGFVSFTDPVKNLHPILQTPVRTFIGRRLYHL